MKTLKKEKAMVPKEKFVNQKTEPQVPAPRQVLIVEDDPHWQRLLGAMLRAVEQDIEVRGVSSADQASASLRDNKPWDLIIVDYFLQGDETGLDLLEEIELRSSGSPVLFVSGLESQELYRQARARDLKNASFVSKASRIDTLKSFLAQSLYLSRSTPVALPEATTVAATQDLGDLMFLLTLLSFLLVATFSVRVLLAPGTEAPKATSPFSRLDAGAKNMMDVVRGLHRSDFSSH